MFLNNLGDKYILQDSLCSTKVSEGQIVNCVLDEMGIFDAAWEQVTVNNSNANETAFHNLSLTDCTIYRSSLMNATFDACSLNSVVYSGDTLIKGVWNKCRMNQVTFKQSTMQRAVIRNCILQNSLFSDFEGIYAKLQDSVFNGCRFENTWEAGMNGFSGAVFENCIFINCVFSGYPLRGVNTASCVFINCSGEITDDAACENTYTNSYALSRYCTGVKAAALSNEKEAQKIIKEGVL